MLVGAGERLSPRSLIAHEWRRSCGQVKVASMSVTKEADRRVAIADAAILVLAEEGARGLTHRAVDRQLGLPDGSTSYYFRTRAALINSAADRLVALDLADVEALAGVTPDLVQLMSHWMSPALRPRLVARFQLFVEASRDLEIRKLLTEPRKAFLTHAARSMRKAGVDDPKLAALVLVSTIDGLLLNELIGEPLSTDRLRRMAPMLTRFSHS
jgi:DNA-binding transcriptional regulator YbjK